MLQMSDVAQGALYVAKQKGVQDNWAQENPNHPFDAKAQLLGSSTYQVVYTRLETERKVDTKGSITKITMTCTRFCDLINEIDMCIEIPDGLSINDILDRVDVFDGNTYIDRLNTPDIETQVKTNCDLWNRKVTTIGDKTFIPLAVAPFHPNNLVFPSAKHHELQIIVTLKKDVDVSLYGNAYFLADSADRQRLIESPHAFVTVQNQFCGTKTLYAGTNNIKLRFNHTVYVLYFWGPNSSLIKNVKLEFDNMTFYDGPVEPLIHKQRQRGITTDVVAIFFSPDPLSSETKSSVNFSKIQTVKLIIDTNFAERCSSDLHVVALSTQPFRYCNGMVGLAFSG